MMTRPVILPDFYYEYATAQMLGRRDCQEDAVLGSFALGSDFGFVVLADGMGGHAAGNIASRIVVTEVFSELMFRSADVDAIGSALPDVLRAAALAADDCIAAHVLSDPATKGMGATLIAPVILRGALWWISIGDSPLFLFRNGVLQQMNEDHSLAPQIDFMIAKGMIDRAVGLTHPDRNILTSALFGGQVSQIDCPTTPVSLQPGDIVIVASDGLQFLDNHTIAAVLSAAQVQTSTTIARALLAKVAALDDPDQDNLSFAVIRVLPDDQVAAPPMAFQNGETASTGDGNQTFSCVI